MSKRPSFQFYWRDFLADPPVTVMSCEEVGAYLLLLIWQWQEGSVPDNLADAIPAARATRRRVAAMLPHLDPCFPGCPDGKRRNRRMERVRGEADEFAARQRDNGALGGRPPKNPGLSSGLSLGFATHNPDESQPEPKKSSASASASALLHSPPTPSQPKAQAAMAGFLLPDWLPASLWDDWVTHRLLIRKPIKSLSQAKYCIRELEKLRLEGHSPEAMISLAISSGWQGFFAPKGAPAHPNGTRQAQLPPSFQLAPNEGISADTAERARSLRERTDEERREKQAEFFRRESKFSALMKWGTMTDDDRRWHAEHNSAPAGVRA